MQKAKGKKKVKKKKCKSVRGWIIFGVVSILVVVGVATVLIYAFQSLGLKGVSFSAKVVFMKMTLTWRLSRRGCF